MSCQWNPAAIVMAGLGLLCLVSTVRVLHRHRGVGSKTYALLMLALAVWQLSYGLEICATALPLDMLCAQICYIGITTVPVLWFTFALQYASRGRQPRFWFHAMLYVIPTITFCMVAMRPYSGLVWRNISLDTSGPFPIMTADYGPWFWAHSVYSYAGMLAGSVIVMRTVAMAPPAQRSHQMMARVAGATLLPFAANLAYLFAPAGLIFLDLSPIALTISSIWLMSLLLQQGLMPTLSLAHLSIVQNMRDGVMVLDTNDQVVDLNPAAERMLGRSASDFMGQCPGMALGLSIEQCIALTESAGKGLATLSLPGTDHTLQVRMSPLAGPDGQILGSLVLFNDVTEDLEAEAKVRQSLAELSILIENLRLGVMVHDQESIVHHCNRYLCEMFDMDCNPDQIIGQSLHDVGSHMLDAFHAPDQFHDLVRQAASGEPSLSDRNVLLNDGRTLECSGYPVQHGGTEGSYLWLWRDVSQQREMARRSQDILRMEMVGRLAGGVAHEFNNLLTVINGYSELLRAQMAPGSEAHHDATSVLEAGQRAAELTHQLLAYSRRQTLLVQSFDLDVLLIEIKPTLVRLLSQHQATILVTVLSPEPVWVRADRDQITQVVLQLATNAHDVMPDSGRLTVEVRQTDLTPERAEQLDVVSGSYGVISVTDTGPGLSVQARDHLFEPFFTTKEVGEGTGLGLAMAYGVVRQSHGAIEVESAAGKGSTFRVLLPIATPEQPLGEQVALHDQDTHSQ